MKVQVPAGGVLPACADLEDNDGDGKTDLADPGCNGPLDEDEFNPPPAPAGGRRHGHDAGGGGAAGGDGGGGQLGPGAPGGKEGRQAEGRGAPDAGIFGQKAPKGGAVQGEAEREKFEERADPQPRRLARPTPTPA